MTIWDIGIYLKKEDFSLAIEMQPDKRFKVQLKKNRIPVGEGSSLNLSDAIEFAMDDRRRRLQARNENRWVRCPTCNEISSFAVPISTNKASFICIKKHRWEKITEIGDCVRMTDGIIWFWTGDTWSIKEQP